MILCTMYTHTYIYVRKTVRCEGWERQVEMYLGQFWQRVKNSMNPSSNNNENIYFHAFFSFQLPERAIFQIKQYNSTSCGVSGWQLEEAQVFWAKQEQSLALNILKQMIKKLDASCSEVHSFFIGWINIFL